MTSYRKIDTCNLLFSPELARDGSVVVSALEHPLLVTTDIVSIGPVPDDSTDFVVLQNLSESLGDFLTAVESRAMETCVANVKAWFGEGFDTDRLTAVRRRITMDGGSTDVLSGEGVFRSFLTEDSSSVKVRVNDETTCFDARNDVVEFPEHGAKVRAVLEATALSMTKYEVGVVWTLRQLKRVDVLIEEEDPVDPVNPEPVAILAGHADGLDDSIA